VTSGDRPGLPLTAEPASFLHADRVTVPLAVATQPAGHLLPLEAEPALWPSPRPSVTRRRPPSPATAAAPPRPGGSGLPATGGTLPAWAGVAAIAAAGLLRWRTRQATGADLGSRARRPA
jgi:LPXTG-motif cell wall-anchored protein